MAVEFRHSQLEGFWWLALLKPIVIRLALKTQGKTTKNPLSDVKTVSSQPNTNHKSLKGTTLHLPCRKLIKVDNLVLSTH